MQSNLISNYSSHKTDYSPFTMHAEEVENSFLFSAICGFTGGMIISQGLSNRTTWPLHFTIPVPLLTFLIPNAEKNSSLKTRIYSCAASLFSVYNIGILSSFGLGIATQNFVNFCIEPPEQQLFSNEQQNSILLYQGTLIVVHLLSRYASYSIKSIEENQYQKKNREFEKPIENLNIKFKEEILKLKALNNLLEDNFDKLRTFIDNDLFLLDTFNTCFKKSKNKLLKPYVKKDENPFDNPTVEEWRQERNRFQYNKSLFAILKDLFEKNEHLYALLEKKIIKKGEEKKFQFILNHEMLLLTSDNFG
ncbi:MAG: hypothetical protein H0V82_03195 [Candidatus Protochlamydia sp.]|nr:hypothetical protein [Candidatus Protochlamydia sp.]